MNHQPVVKIISWNAYGEEVCASAARISTTEGSAVKIFDKSLNDPHNLELIGKVLKSGHRSLMEHMVFNIAMENVSVYAEQYFIEMRLAAFTVKSRRYVDFSGQGYYIPESLEGEDLELYKKHMEGLFKTYRDLIALNIPKEDARFILPYSFCSNFYCTLNARELAALIRSIRCGRGRTSPELLDIARRLEKQAVEIFPAIAQEIPTEPSKEDTPEPTAPNFGKVCGVCFINQSDIGEVSLFSRPENPMCNLSMAYDLIPLAGLTHLTRHRMQSPIIPPVETANLGRIVMPDSIAQNEAAMEIYTTQITWAYICARKLLQRKALRSYVGYFALAGNLVDVATIMNARELKHFIQLRSCIRAQWEIRKIAIDMLRLLRENYPELFNLYGPSCYLTGVCPEGKMCCGRTKEVQKYFSSNLDEKQPR